MAERVGFEPTVGYKPTPIFKTGAINQLDHLSTLVVQLVEQHIYFNTVFIDLSIDFFYFLFFVIKLFVCSAISMAYSSSCDN